LVRCVDEAVNNWNRSECFLFVHLAIHVGGGPLFMDAGFEGIAREVTFEVLGGSVSFALFVGEVNRLGKSRSVGEGVEAICSTDGMRRSGIIRSFGLARFFPRGGVCFAASNRQYRDERDNQNQSP